MKIYSLTGFPSALTGSFTGSFVGDGSGLSGTDSGSWDGDFVGSAKITGSLSLSGSFKDQESSPGTAGQVLSSTVSGSKWVDVEDPDAVTGSGTVGTISKWATSTSLGNSIIAEAASAITVSGDATFTKDQNADTSIKLFNPNAGTATEATIYVTNSSTNANGLFLGTTGVNTTTAGGFVQDGSHIGSGTGAAGGLSIMTRAAADIRFYTNGHTNERMRITSGGNVGIGVTPSSKMSIGGNAITTLKPTLVVSDTNNGGSLTLRGQSPTIYFDKTSTGIPKILTDGGGIEFRNGTLDAEGSVDLKITSGGNVGIGTDSPNSKLEVISGASHGTGFTQTRSGHPSFSLLNGGTNSVYLGIAPSGGSYNTFMQVVEDDTDIDYIRFNTGASTERMRIQSDGDINISGGRILSSGGIYLGTNNNVNLLSDYEEGTWTPTISSLFNCTSIATTKENFTRIGNLVTCAFEVSGNITSSSSEMYFAFTTPFTMHSTSTPFVGHVGFFIGTGGNRFGVGSVYEGTSSNTITFIFIASNQLNTSGSFTGMRMTFTFQTL